MRSNPTLTLADVQAAVQQTIKAAIEPLSTQVGKLTEKVDDLNADHVRREDIDAIRREMIQGFTGLETKYLPREIADRRLSELEEAIKSERSERMENQKALASSGMNQWYKISMLIGGVLGFLSFLLNAISHISFHP